MEKRADARTMSAEIFEDCGNFDTFKLKQRVNLSLPPYF